MGHVTILYPIIYAISYWWSFGSKPLSLTVSEIFNVQCNATVDVTLIRPCYETKVKVIHFDTNLFLIGLYDFLWAVNLLCSFTPFGQSI